MEVSSLNYRPDNYENMVLENKIRDIFNTRAQHLESYAAAFVREVGSREASKYELVETIRQVDGGYETTWEFRRVEEL